jgi:hypothetical protein
MEALVRAIAALTPADAAATHQVRQRHAGWICAT